MGDLSEKVRFRQKLVQSARHGMAWPSHCIFLWSKVSMSILGNSYVFTVFRLKLKGRIWGNFGLLILLLSGLDSSYHRIRMEIITRIKLKYEVNSNRWSPSAGEGSVQCAHQSWVRTIKLSEWAIISP